MLTALLLGSCATGSAGSDSSVSQLRPYRLISDGMVLQRNQPLELRGEATPETDVLLQFREQTYTGRADQHGRWKIALPPMSAGGPFMMEFTDEHDGYYRVENIMLGDVWIASGQSNMELPMRRVQPLYRQELAEDHFPDIRHFEVPKRYDFDMANEDLPGGRWRAATTQNLPELSAVAHFFSRHLHQHEGVAIGIINASLGGSPAEAWMSESALESFPAHYAEAQRFKNDDLITKIEAADQARAASWYAEAERQDNGPEAGHTWHHMQVPGYWADQPETGEVNGIAWFRRTIDLPESMAGKPMKLELGRIVDADSTFINGQFVGNTTYQYPPRWYEVPAGVLDEGENTITVKVINPAGRGGFFYDKPYELTSETDTLDLRGRWEYRITAEMPPLEPQTFIRWKPLGLYNAMIAPIQFYGARGVIWYQGESNTGRPAEYASLFPAMIQDWREGFAQEELPFLFVQLANFMKPAGQPQESNWAQLRASQEAALRLPQTGMAVTIDIGEWNDIHPLNKKDVGERLALSARHVAYGEDLVHSGPLYEAMRIENDRIMISFSNTGSGLITSDGGPPAHVAIAGVDGDFVWAEATIEDNELVVWSPQVPEPRHVRYAWADNPESANLYNAEGLPAAPFRTDRPR
ncbi:MAG: sialate O-acetylesterase [Cyclonatronaceae bacterium]